MKKAIFSFIVGVMIIGAFVPYQQAFGTVFDCSATLDGTQEVPPTGALGTGTASITYNDVSNALGWNIAYSGLTVPPSASHFHHGSVGISGPVKVPIPVSPSPLIGNNILSPADEGLLLAGDMYINIHTTTFPPGEIRGQVLCIPRMLSPVGGELIPLDTTMVLVAGTHSVAAWMIPVIVSAIGIGIVIARKF